MQIEKDQLRVNLFCKRAIFPKHTTTRKALTWGCINVSMNDDELFIMAVV